MTIRCKITEYVTSYEVTDCGYLTNDVMIVNDKCVFLGEVIDMHDKARSVGLSDGAVSQTGEGENL
jgi:hypothetical protein